MRIISPATEKAWKAPVKDGPNRPYARATVQRYSMHRFAYNTADAPGGDYDVERARTGYFTTFLLGQDRRVFEIRNLRKVGWSRSVEQDIAECTLTVLNSEISAIGSLAAEDNQGEDFGLPGYFTYNRGTPKVEPSPWGYTANTGWNNLLVPDRVIKTYEGYGEPDGTVMPGDDQNLYITGTWLIDEVTYASNGDLTIACRDMGRLLIDHIVIPPIVPWADYPLSWSKIQSVNVEGRDSLGGSWDQPRASATSSNNLYVGKGIKDDPRYVGPGGSVQGHRNSDPTRDGPGYWLSTGQDTANDMVWWEQTFDRPQNIAALKLTTFSGPYKVYVSFQLAGSNRWVGKKEIPYEVGTEGVDLKADIPFVEAFASERGLTFDHTLRKKYRGVKKMRLTFTSLRVLGTGRHRWRAGLRDVQVYVGDYDKLHFGKGKIRKAVGNYRDYTDIVKWACAWSGFYWPGADQANWIVYSTNGEKVHYRWTQRDVVLPKGRVWGSFQPTGTAGVADLTADQFDKQPMMDMINYVRDITGFFFCVDEVGGVVWRMPNLYQQGNYLTPDHKTNRRFPNRTDAFVTIDEKTTLLEYSTKLSSRNLRERVFVGDVAGKVGAMVRGYAPYWSGMRRIAGWTDQNWKTNRECRVAADMIVARQMFDFRRGTARVHGNPAIQVDDQIRIYERITNETYFHYVLGIDSELDNEAGTWTYQLSTHWLGERISDAWVVKPEVLDFFTQAYLDHLGSVQ